MTRLRKRSAIGNRALEESTLGRLRAGGATLARQTTAARHNGSYVTGPDNRGMESRLKPELHTPSPTQGACNLQIVPAERRVVH